MFCGSTRNLIISEMTTMLKQIESENSYFEKERNELKSIYHNRPTEERNIVKDILIMHTDFDGGVNKLKDIVEELVTIPSEKTVTTDKAQDLASQIVVMQSSLVRKNDILQKCLVQKIHYQTLKDEAKVNINEATRDKDQMKFKRIEISNYEHHDIFVKKIKFLKSEIERFKGLITNLKSNNYDEEYALNEEESAVMMLNDKQAFMKLQQVVDESMRIEEEIGRINTKIMGKAAYGKDRILIDQKKMRIGELKIKLRNLNEEDARFNEDGREDECTKKIRILDGIIGWKKETVKNKIGMQDLRNKSMLKEIEASLNRIKLYSSQSGEYR
ncbi:hypothetical protein SteCoe_3519 [Stentor coeruleus]|uniref:Uncharacterized protein n=1 Tax=Stentor coeruleus TaxID=5963 RepID=A0A1R2CX00_9CILI|nr:hypothetical protein SteCoe_3519 [Stentor coeruleus]